MATSTENLEQPATPAGRSKQSRRLGLRSKLFLAFVSMACLTVGASMVAWYAFVKVEKSVTEITGHSIPAMSASLRLAEKSAELTAMAPTLMTSQNQEERVRAQVALESRVKELELLLKQLAGGQIDTSAAQDLTRIYQSIVTELKKLNSAVDIGLTLKSKRELAVDHVTTQHQKFLEILEPIVDDAIFDLVMSSETLSTQGKQALGGLMEGGVVTLNRLLEINVKVGSVATILTKLIYLSNPASIQPLHERFVAAAHGINRAFDELPDDRGKRALGKGLDTLLRMGQGQGNLFEVTAGELRSDGLSSAELSKHRKRASRALEIAHSNILMVVTPLVDDASFDMVISSEKIAEEGGASFIRLVDGGVNDVTTLLLMRAEANLVAGLLSEAASVIDSNILQPVRERFIAAANHLRKRKLKLASAPASGLLHASVQSLVGLGEGTDSIFGLRDRELQQGVIAAQALRSNRALTEKLRSKIDTLVSNVQSQGFEAARASTDSTRQGKQLLLFITALSILGAGCIIIFYVAPRVVVPLEAMTNAMGDIAEGDTGTKIPGQQRGDEIGRMAQALNVFRDTTKEMQESNLREIRESRQRLTDAIESISEGFSLYDTEDQLVVCNNRYREMLYPGLEEIIKPGMPFKTILRSAVDRGLVRDAEGREDEWIEQRMAAHRNPGAPHIQQRGDDRWIQVNEKMTDNGFTVAVYTDISPLKKAEESASTAKEEAEQALQDLTQAQETLIHAEKMASLGQLTAGIAHEIKNPLNFVNNFADVSGELLIELRQVLESSFETLNQDEREDADDLITTLTGNLEKIRQHGVRADRIVKGMLEHSRQGPGALSLVDLNALVDDVLNLAYHGMRGEDEGFNATLERNLDPVIGDINLFQQEITQVLLNIIGNGLYALRQRKLEGEAEYEPTITVSTKNLGDEVQIRIRDNGTGIPQNVKEKIFNPFFTTKPTGDGTGLGLSLSFDIVVKQHNGTLDVNTQPGEFTEFIINLPQTLVDAQKLMG